MTAILGNSTPTTNQNSTNALVNVQLLGSNFATCDPSAGPCTGTTTLIGGSAQANQQGVNSSQSGANASGTTGTLVVGGDSTGTLNQNSTNALINVALIG